jgi:hypothetical protein
MSHAQLALRISARFAAEAGVSRGSSVQLTRDKLSWAPQEGPAVTTIDALLSGAVLPRLVLDAAFVWWYANPAAGLMIVHYAALEARDTVTRTPAHNDAVAR